MRVYDDMGTDQQQLIRVVFERQTPDANATMIEAVYEARYPEDHFLSDDTVILIPLSITRMDTRRPVILTDEEQDKCHQVASEKAAEMMSHS